MTPNHTPARRTAPTLVASIVTTAIGALAALPVAAADAAHPWLSAPVPLPQPETYFTNLRDGDKVESPFVLKFGLARGALAGTAKGVPKTGHHHLLANRDLPLDFSEPLPFNDQYRHFGTGEMEAVLEFKPGTYTLRLLPTDHKHIPHFIYSKPMTITVTAKRNGVDPRLLVTPGVELLSPRDGAMLTPQFRVQFHASGLNLSHVEIKDNGVGHFRLVMQPEFGTSERIDFDNGATEAWLKPPAGDYSMKLELVSNGDPATVMASSSSLSVKVAPSQGVTPTAIAPTAARQAVTAR